MDRVQISLYPTSRLGWPSPNRLPLTNGITTHSTSRKETEEMWESKDSLWAVSRPQDESKNKEHKIQLLSFCSPFDLQLSNRIAFLPSHQKRKGRICYYIMHQAAWPDANSHQKCKASVLDADAYIYRLCSSYWSPRFSLYSRREEWITVRNKPVILTQAVFWIFLGNIRTCTADYVDSELREAFSVHVFIECGILRMFFVKKTFLKAVNVIPYNEIIFFLKKR